MKVYIYSIYDKVADVFNKPFQEVNDASAKRAFIDGISEQPHKNDYELWKLAELDNTTGEVEIVCTQDKTSYPHRLITGLAVTQEEPHYTEEMKLKEVK